VCPTGILHASYSRGVQKPYPLLSIAFGYYEMSVGPHSETSEVIDDCVHRTHIFRRMSADSACTVIGCSFISIEIVLQSRSDVEFKGLNVRLVLGPEDTRRRLSTRPTRVRTHQITAVLLQPYVRVGRTPPILCQELVDISRAFIVRKVIAKQWYARHHVERTAR